MIYFDQRGVSRQYEVRLADGRMEWRRDDAKISQRMTFTSDGGRIEMTGQMS